MGLTDDILGYLFAVRSGVCGQSMEVKINDVRFVCFPLQLPQPLAGAPADSHGDLPTLLLFNIVFALRVSTSVSKVFDNNESILGNNSSFIRALLPRFEQTFGHRFAVRRNQVPILEQTSADYVGMPRRGAEFA